KSDLRGADFTGADLTGADFTIAKTGITPLNTVLIFIAALIVSAVSGYVAMLAGHTVQQMFASKDHYVKTAGIVSTIMIVMFIVFAYWKGVGHAITHLILPASIIALLVGLISYWTGAGTGRGMLYLVIACVLVAIMFIVGTIARAAAGALSNILFVVVAL